MKIKTLVKWLENWNQNLEIDNLEFTDSLRDELGLEITDLEYSENEDYT